jgi:carboxyl-terminal processing protease
VRYRWENNSILFIKIHTFNLKFSQIIKNLIEEIKNKKIKGVIIDLRDNNGGLLEQAVEFARYFIPSGKIVSIYSRNPENNEDYEGIGKDWFYGVPTVVLINRYSASASEIVAGALKDHKRALLIGEKTYGKGSVQTLIKIPGWGGIRLTTGYFQTPLGEVINKKGVKPHICIKNSTHEKDFPLEKALQWLRESPLRKAS